MTAYTLFISDLHLQASTPAITELLLQFIEEEASNADALYILGDLFEAWIGDDDDNPFHRTVKDVLQQLDKSGVPVFLIHGNRDFLIGKRFADETQINLLPDPCVITLYQQRVLLSHGDLLCTLDVRHQRYRRIVLKPWCQKLLLSLPLKTRRKIANRLRDKSQTNNQNTPANIMDVTPDAVERLMKQHHSNILIHGHTHRPKIHRLTSPDQDAKRIVLGAWHDDSAQYLRFYANGEQELAEIIKI